MQPLAVGGVIVSDRAATVPALSFGPIAVTHSPVWSAVAWITVEVVTFTVVGTLMVVDGAGRFGERDRGAGHRLDQATRSREPGGAGGRREARPRRVAPGRGLTNVRRLHRIPVVAHEPLTGALRRTVVAVSVPVASLVPVAVMHMPEVMFARVPVLVWVIVVVGA